MAHAVQLTIRTGSQVTIGEGVQEVGVALTYELERADVDLMQVVEDKAAEVARAHRKTWRVLHDQAVEAAREANANGHDPDRQNAAPEESLDAQAAQEQAAQEQAARELAPEVEGEVKAEAEGEVAPSSTAAQQAAIRLLLDHTGVSEAEVSEATGVTFTRRNLHTLSREQASKVLLALQRAERVCYASRKAEAGVVA